MEYEISTLCRQSRAVILRLDLRLVDCPGELTDMWTEEKGVRRRIFTDDDIQAVRKMLGRADEERGTFASEYKYFEALRTLYAVPVFGYGNFVLAKNLANLYDNVDGLNKQLSELRHKVCGLLEDRYGHGIEMHRKILRFNPRVKLGTYILTEAFAHDKCFQRAVEIACYKLRRKETMPELLGL